MSRYLFCLLALLSGLNLSLANDEGRRREIINLLNQEISEVSRLSKQIGHQNPKLLLRMAELYLEKGRLLKETENRRFLELPIKKRKRLDKDKFFKNSRKYFVRAQKICLDVLANFKSFKGKADVYYILAYNAKEFERNKQAKRYFVLAGKSQSRRRDSKVRVKSDLALADLYFNEGEYRKAIPVYESALRAHKDRWWTKDAYNLAWSYFRTKRYNKAIKLMQQVYRMGKSGEYIDMSDLAINNLAQFYAESDQVVRGIKFFKSVGKDISTYFVRVAKILLLKGKNTRAEKVIKIGVKYTKEKERIELYFMQLRLYDKYYKTKGHYDVTKVLYQYFQQKKLNADQIKEFSTKMQAIAALLQRQVISKTYRRVDKIRNGKANLAVSYFDIISVVDPKLRLRMQFYAGETLFAVGRYQEAFEKYKIAYEMAVREKSNKYEKLSVTGMLACLQDISKINKKNLDSYLVYAYSAYLRRSPKSRQANSIYQKLFRIYGDRKDLGKMEETLERYRRHFPRQWAKQEAMIAEIMEINRRRDNKDEIYRWISRINKKEFKISKAYAQKLRILLTNFQLSQAQEAVKSNKKLEALEAYLKVFENKASTQDSRVNAAYNIAILYYEAGFIDQSQKYAEWAIKHMSYKEFLQYEKSFLAISTELFNRGQTKESALFSQGLLNRVCKKRSKNKQNYFRNSLTMFLAIDQYEAAENVLNTYRRCRGDSTQISNAEYQLVDYYADKKNYPKLLNSYESFKLGQQRNTHSLWLSGLLANFFPDNRKIRSLYRSKALNLYSYLKKRKRKISARALDLVAILKLDELEQMKRLVFADKLRFPEKTFNQILEKKLGLLDQFTERAIAVLQMGSGEGVSGAYYYLSDVYSKLADEIKSFQPPKKDKNYIASFKQGMISLTRPIEQKAKENLSVAKEQLVRLKVLSKNNWRILQDHKSGLNRVQMVQEVLFHPTERLGKI